MRRVYLDTCIFVAAFETENDGSIEAKRLLASLVGRPHEAATSELTIAELLAPVSRRGVMSIEERKRVYLPLLLEEGQFIDLIPMTRAILIETIELRALSRHKLADAIHIATAAHEKCHFFVSSDRDARRLPSALTCMTPSGIDVDTMLKALDA